MNMPSLTTAPKGSLKVLIANAKTTADWSTLNRGRSCSGSSRAQDSSHMALGCSCLPPSPRRALYQALQHDDIDLAWNVVRQNPPDCDYNIQVGGRGLLHLATAYQDRRLVQALVDNRIDVDAVNERGETALYIACLSGHLDIVNIIVEASVDLDRPDNEGTSPFMVACWRGHVAIARFLYENGVSCYRRNHRNESALSLAGTWSQLSSLAFLVAIVMEDVDNLIAKSGHIPEPAVLQSKIRSCYGKITQQHDQMASLYAFGADLLLPLHAMLSEQAGRDFQHARLNEINSRLNAI